ncbi:M48 family metallopeptidase [Salininema proteolyticum]|uniref:M48 family metallopeptidase n=1 Tax=Salininema proteolyticum TaxID=1607685 RepID=A0ABV8TUM5_9ACTN
MIGTGKRDRPARRPTVVPHLATATTLRFLQLVALLTVSAATMILEVRNLLDAETGRERCFRAAGVNFELDAPVNAAANYARNADMIATCVERYPSPTIWVGLVWTALLAFATYSLFHLIPLWKSRRALVVPLKSVDQNGAMDRHLRSLAEHAGLRRFPRVYVDPANPSTDALVYGTDRHPRLRLHAGLFELRRSDPDAFESVVLHEFGHIRNRDITITYTVIALWRVFLVLVLLPHLAVRAYSLRTAVVDYAWAENLVGIHTFNMVSTGLMTLLIYLARTDVLRARELHADLAAIEWGGDPHRRTSSDNEEGQERKHQRRRIRARFLDLWRNHPHVDLRAAAAREPALALRITPLAMVLTGLATSIIFLRVYSTLNAATVPDVVSTGLAALVGAAPAAGITAIHLWQSARLPESSGVRRPSGVAVGAWLGLGMAVGTALLDGNISLTRLPSHPEAPLMLVLLGTLFGWWAAQSVRVWAASRGDRFRWASPTAALVSFWIALTGLLVVWRFASGYYHGPINFFDAEALRQSWEDIIVSKGGEADSFVTAMWVWLFPVSMVALVPYLWTAIAALWGVVLLRPHGRDAEGPLRFCLRPALVGFGAGTALILTIRFFTDGGESAKLGDIEHAVFYYWSAAAVLIGVTIAAVGAARRADEARLLNALTASQLALWSGVAAFVLLTSADGCLGPFDTFATECSPPQPVAWTELRGLLDVVMIACLLVALLAAPVGRAASRFRPGPRTAAGSGSRVRTAFLAVVFLAVVVTSAARDLHYAKTLADPDYAQLDGLITTRDSKPRELVETQLWAWYEEGGEDLVVRFATEWSEIYDILGELRDAPEDERTQDRHYEIAMACYDLWGAVDEAYDYFYYPDPDLEEAWEDLLGDLFSDASDCVDGYNAYREGESGEQYADAVRRLTQVTAEQLLVFMEEAKKHRG